MTTLSLAALQTDRSGTADFDALQADVRKAAKRFPWVEMVVLGELAAHGPSTAKAEAPGGATLSAFRDLARELDIWLMPGSYYERRGDGVYNTAPVIDPSGQVVAQHDKIYPFLPYEKGVAAGRNWCTFDMPGVGTVGVAICYDMWFPEVIRTLCTMGAEVILLPTLTNTIDRDVELAIARANAAMNQCYFVDLNLAAPLGNGRSAVFGPGGEEVYKAGTGAEVIALELDLEHVRRTRERGWHGLGQTMKSFRDNPIAFPFHADPGARRSALSGLGPLEVPRRPDTDRRSDDTRVEPCRGAAE